MPLPTPDAYNDAVQNPQLAFADPELASASVDCNGFGIPKALGGGFAITYRLVARGGKAFAVRCFHKEASNLQGRYSSIHSCLKSLNSPLFVDFEYQQSGIRIRGERLPIVKMEWATGVTLGEYIEQNYANRSAIQQLRKSFAQMELQLANLTVAHGDLQNFNILVSPQGQLRLVDYDGMFVPGMKTGGGVELGHKHFQHPNRTSDEFSHLMDRFSYIAIDLSLWALFVDPSFYRKHSNGDNILFNANDYSDPSSSQLFAKLLTIGDSKFQKAVSSFAVICQSSVSAVPRLSEFISGFNSPVLPISHPIKTPVSQKYIAALDVVDGNSFEQVYKHIGDRVELIGKVVKVCERQTNKGKTYVFINFGDEEGKHARIVIWPPALKKLTEKPEIKWAGQWIAFNCLIEPVNRRSGNKAVGATLSVGMRLYKITEEEALWRLGRGPRPGYSRIASPQSSTTMNNSLVLKELEGRSRSEVVPQTTVPPMPQKPATPPQKQPAPTSIHAKNEAILKSLQQSKSTNTLDAQNSPSSGGVPRPSNTQTGCLVLLGSMMSLLVLLAYLAMP